MNLSTDQSSYTGRLTAWLAAPFSESMSAVSWALFIGFALIVIFFWTRILNYIGETV